MDEAAKKGITVKETAFVVGNENKGGLSAY
jgi:hypothetical protein